MPGYDATNPTWRFNEFTSGFSDSNFRNGDPEKWVITSAPIVNSGERAGILLAADQRPEPRAGYAPDLLGREARLADLGVRSRHRRPRAAGLDPRHRGLRGELPGIRDLRRSGRLRRLPAARRPVLRRALRHGGDPVVQRPAGRPHRYGVRVGPLGRLDLVACPRQRRPRDTVGSDLGRPDLRDAQRRCGGSGRP